MKLPMGFLNKHVDSMVQFWSPPKKWREWKAQLVNHLDKWSWIFWRFYTLKVPWKRLIMDKRHMIGAMFLDEFMYKVRNKLYSIVYFVRLWSHEKDSRVLWTVNKWNFLWDFWTNLLTQWCNWGHHLKNKRMKSTSKSFIQKVLNFLKILLIKRTKPSHSYHIAYISNSKVQQFSFIEQSNTQGPKKLLMELKT
jgi:hypothetical protein